MATQTLLGSAILHSPNLSMESRNDAPTKDAHAEELDAQYIKLNHQESGTPDPHPFSHKLNKLTGLIDPEPLKELPCNIGGINGLPSTFLKRGIVGLKTAEEKQEGHATGISHRGVRGIVVTSLSSDNSQVELKKPSSAVMATLGEYCRVLPLCPSKSLLQLIDLTLQDNVVILLSATAVILFVFNSVHGFGDPCKRSGSLAYRTEELVTMIAVCVNFILAPHLETVTHYAWHPGQTLCHVPAVALIPKHLSAATLIPLTIQDDESIVGIDFDNGSPGAPVHTIAGILRCDDPTEAISKATQDPDFASEFISVKGNKARCALNAVQLWLDKHPQSPLYRRGIYLMMKLATASGELPPSLYLDGITVDEGPIAYGGFADVYRGTYNTRDVAVKRLRLNATNSDKTHKLFHREVLLWRQLKHPHVLPFIGIDAHSFKKAGHLCMVSPWLAGGSLSQQIEEGNYGMDRRRLLNEVAQGLAYLHSQKVVHGDIHGRNVLITVSGSACLADFGIANIGDVTVGRPTVTPHNAGAIRWMAPERFTQREAMLGKEVDVWAFACLCLMVYTFQRPFHDIDNDYMVILCVASGQTPKRPSENECHGYQIPDRLWEVMTDCWSFVSRNRPSMESILTRLKGTIFDASGDSKGFCFI